MANKTTNFNLDLPTGDELFNPLWPNSNTAKIDAQMKKNMDNSITKADCVFNTNKFIITREDNSGKIFKFIAPHDFVAGYTFTVDGTAMDGIVAGTGDALADGCFMNGHEVIAYIDETTASLAFLVGSSLPDAIDATTLGGHGVDYFATAAGLAATNKVATSAGQVANQALEAAQKAGIKITTLWENPNVMGSFTDDQEYNFSTPLPKDTKLIAVEYGGVVADSPIYHSCAFTLYIPNKNSIQLETPYLEGQEAFAAGRTSNKRLITLLFNDLTTNGTFSAHGYGSANSVNTIANASVALFKIFAIS